MAGNKVLFVVLLAFVAIVYATRGALTVDNQDCSNFPSQAAAQAHLRADPSDPDGLDAHVGPADGNDRAGGDGIACQSRPAPFDRRPVFAPGTPVPHGAASNSGRLPFTGPHNLVPQAAIGGLFLVAGAVLLWRTRQRPRQTS